MQTFSLNIRGRLHEYTGPVVMGVVNVTPDSFYAPSRALDAELVKARVREMIDEGADIIDVGAFSTRPGHAEVDEAEEMQRLAVGLAAVRSVSTDVVVSVDTFRPEVARKAVELYGADIINDISGNPGMRMGAVAADLRVPYILTHNTADDEAAATADDVLPTVLQWMLHKVSELQLAGVNDIIVDPGLGFGLTIEGNYRLLNNLEVFRQFGLPILVGMSRKSMITDLLGITPDASLNGTTVLNTLALDRGASILRVHDVAAARQVVTLYEYTGKH